MPHDRLNFPPFNRRSFLKRCGMGMGTLGLAALLKDAGLLTAHATSNVAPLSPRQPHFPGKAKRVVHFFLNGGPSHVDTFDPKPALEKYAGKPLPMETLKTERKTGAAFPSPFKFKKQGQSGLEISELFSNLGECADDLTIIRSMRANLPNHEPSLMLMNCGESVMSRPSVGSWVTYGLGSMNENLPGFVVLCPGGYPIKEAENWQSAFLPGVFQGTLIDSQHQSLDKLIENIRSDYASPGLQRKQLDLLQRMNEEHRQTRQEDPALEAYRMQMEAADAFDISREPRETQELYGSGIHGRQALIARRLLEKGVRYVQVWHGASQPWDDHENIAANHRKLAGQCDQPIAALIKDLKRRGMLDDTLVIVGGEFGRTPVGELVKGKEPSGRDHNPYGFSMVLAGGGVKGGHVHGATDEFGFKAVQDVVHVHDLHATILHLLGFDHEKFTYRYAGRDFRLTDVHGHVVRGVLS